MVLDVRRGDGPKGCFDYTFSAISTTDALIAREPEKALAAIRAIRNTHKAFKKDPSIATKVGEKLFPPQEAELIAELIRRDLPYFDASISEKTIAGVNAFARDMGILKGDVPYDQIVATQFRDAWTA
jgi:ABC-type nitrate/sulfonate/bicarbonate transport system substrate-binding protein